MMSENIHVTILFLLLHIWIYSRWFLEYFIGVMLSDTKNTKTAKNLKSSTAVVQVKLKEYGYLEQYIQYL